MVHVALTSDIRDWDVDKMGDDADAPWRVPTEITKWMWLGITTLFQTSASGK